MTLAPNPEVLDELNIHMGKGIFSIIKYLYVLTVESRIMLEI